MSSDTQEILLDFWVVSFARVPPSTRISSFGGDLAYAFPSYPSAHGTASAAAMTVMADTFGEDRPFTMVTAEVDEAGPFSKKLAMVPPTRSFDSVSAAALECAMSRVYLGIHFRYDSVAGNELGKRIGEYALTDYLE